MECPNCHTDNPDLARFCLHCGQGLGLSCPECGMDLPPQARFCFNCATPVTQPAVHDAATPDTVSSRLQRLIPKEFADRLLATRGPVQAERRAVTIMFCDVKGSTRLAADLDPEDVMEIMDGAFDALIEPIYRYEGTLARLMGDAILAFFGAPVAHEDDAERACRAALAILETVRQYAEELERERGVEGFSVRVGIHTGPVVVGEVGSDLRVEYTAMGDAVNVAARMESAAEPGTILITDETERLISGLFRTEALGPVEVKGKAEPIPAYRLLAPTVARSKARGVAGLDSPLVGREAELAALREAIKRLRAGVGGIVTIAGEAGIGKSRLVAELRKENLAKVSEPLQGLRDLQWLEGRCMSYGTSMAYQLWVDVVRSWFEAAAGGAPARLGEALQGRVHDLCAESYEEVCPYLRRLMSVQASAEEEAALRDLDGESLKAATFRALETLIRCLTNELPLVLVCEDLHWADATSLEVLERLLSLTDRAPLLVVCLFRPDREHGCWRIKEESTRRYPHRHTDVWLDALSVADSEALVGNLLFSTAPFRGVQDLVLRYAQGNPFYVEEVIRSLIDSGIILRDASSGGWYASGDVDGIPLPETLQGVLMARIDRLPEAARQTLRSASVIGRIFGYRLLEAVAGSGAPALEETELRNHLLILQREEMIRERMRVPEPEYIFKHELTREAAYRGLLNRERRVLHRRVAEAMERLFPGRMEEQVGLLAHHWELAGDAAKASTYLLRAGDRARMVYAHEEATDYYRRALVFLKDCGERQEVARTLMKIGLVHTAAFQPDQARAAYDEGFGLWEPVQRAEGRAGIDGPANALRFAVEEPLTLDPGRAGDVTSTFMTGQLFEGLVEVDDDYNVLPAAAARWEVDRDGRRYVFHLQDDLRWSDGRWLVASDFEYAWKRNLLPATRSPVAHLLNSIKNARALAEGEIKDAARVGVAALDDQTLEVRLEAPTAYFLHLLAHPVAYPLCQGVFGAGNKRWEDPHALVGNGPYRLLAWRPGERIVLGRNRFYRGRFSGNVSRVECPLFTDFGPVLEAYATGTLDAVSLITSDPGTIARVRAAHGEELLFTPELSTWYLVLRVDRPPFDDVRVRQAFAHAINREDLARDAWRGQYLPATGGFVPPGMPGHSKGIGLAYDPAQAGGLLTEAGYPGGQGFPRVTWLYSGGSGRGLVVPFLRRAWRQHLGLTLQAQNLEWKDFMERGERDPAHLSLWGWNADYPDPDNMLRVTFHSVEGFNAPRWCNARFDSLVEEAAQVTDQERRMEMYREADRILVAEETVVVPLGYGRGRILAKPGVAVPRVQPTLMRLKNIMHSPTGRADPGL